MFILKSLIWSISLISTIFFATLTYSINMLRSQNTSLFIISKNLRFLKTCSLILESMNDVKNCFYLKDNWTRIEVVQKCTGNELELN